LLLALAPALTAQSFVVDVNGGPGANFTSISAAVAAVPDGATLRVRPGNYAESVVVVGKGLTIIGEAMGSASVAIVAPAGLPALHVAGLAPTQAFVGRSLSMASSGGIPADTRVEFNQGLVFLDGVWSRLRASNCDALLISRCSLFSSTSPVPAATFDTCRTVLDECSVGAVEQVGGDLQIAGGGVVGHQNILGVGGTAVTMQGGALRLLGTQLTSGFSLVAPGLAIGGTGNVRRTPDTVLQGATPSVAPGIAMVTVAMPRVATNWVTGSLYSVYTSGSPGILVGSARALPQSLPGLDPVWLDAATAGIYSPGIVTLPSSPALTGLSIVWQVVSFAPNGAISLSNPTWLVVR
jgi:hypothetical protein